MRLRCAACWISHALTCAVLVLEPLRADAGVSGRIQYHSNRSDVAGVAVQAQGAGTAIVQSNATGHYVFTELGPGSWYVTPRKLGAAGGAVNAVDAVYALQAAVGLRSLSERQQLACDVSGDGKVSAADVVLILQYAVGLATSVPVAQRCGSDWAFVPEPAAAANQQLVAPQPATNPCIAGAIGFDPLLAVAENQDFAAVLFGDCSGSWQPPPMTTPATPTSTPTPTPMPTVGPPEQLRVQVLAVLPHDPSAFTQGLLFHEGRLYESTGRYGSSSLREVERATGQVVRAVDLASNYFGEGLTLVGDRLIQPTWLEHVAFVYDRATFSPLGQFTYPTEGWGICYDGTQLVMSDGSNTLTLRDPGTFAVTRQIGVTLNGLPQAQLNELECVGDHVFANVWLTDTILRIDPRTGIVTAVIDASGLLSPGERAGTDVLNGIAYDGSRRTFLITGKLWPKLFEVQFVANGP